MDLPTASGSFFGTLFSTFAVADWINLSLLIVTSVGLLGIVYQIRESRSAQSREFARMRLENTFRFYDEMRDTTRKNHMRTMQFLATSSRGTTQRPFDPMKDTHVDLLLAKGNEAERRNVIDTLAKLERLAVGIESGLFDEDTVYKLSRSNLSGQLGFYAAYISRARRHTPDAYQAFETLAERLHVRSVEAGDQPSRQYSEARKLGLLPIVNGKT